MASGTIQTITNGAERGVLADADFNSITAKGIYRFSGTPSNAPIDNGILEVFGTSGSSAVVQRVSDGSSSYYRYYNGSIWNDWHQFDTYFGTLIKSGTAHEFTVPNNYRGVLISFATTANNCGIWIISCTGSGSVGRVAVKEASNITWTTATNKLTATYASDTNGRYLAINALYKLS